MKELIAFWVSFLSTHNWHDLVQNVEPRKTGCGIVYELPLISKPGQEFAIVDMRDVAVAEPHYHINGETEIYFVVQGAATIVVGTKEYNVQKGDVIVTPPHTTHFTLPDNDFLIAVVNTPSFSVDNYIPISESDDALGFDKRQYERLVQLKCSQGVHIKHIRLDQTEDIKHIILTVAFSLWPHSKPITFDEFKNYWEAAHEFDDIDTIQATYLKNNGLFLVLLDGEKVVGSGAIKKITDDVCEFTRLWFLPAYQGKGWGLKMSNQLLRFAQQQGYKKVRLEICYPEVQVAAVGLYKKLGFVETAPYTGDTALGMEKCYKMMYTIARNNNNKAQQRRSYEKIYV